MGSNKPRSSDMAEPSLSNDKKDGRSFSSADRLSAGNDTGSHELSTSLDPGSSDAKAEDCDDDDDGMWLCNPATFCTQNPLFFGALFIVRHRGRHMGTLTPSH